jgi:FkbM family methyltransferase
MTIKHELRKLLWNVGYDVSRFDPGSHSTARRRRLLEAFGFDVVLDVGANTGQFAQELREELRFTGHIRSFEPLSSAFRDLDARASADPRWQVFNFALGDTDGMTYINVSRNSYSSSILEMLPSHADAAPESRFVRREEIAIRTLDSIFDDVSPPGERILLKIDTQGFEGRVLRGAERSLERIAAVQLEMPLIPLYDGELSFIELYQRLIDGGYALVALEPGFTDPRTGRLLQVDGIFHRAE